MTLDDTAVWAEVAALRECSDKVVAELARRLVDRNLYKCFDFGSRMQSGTDQPQRFALNVNEAQDRGEFDGDFRPLLDEPSVQIYKWYDFESDDPLNKVMVMDPRRNGKLTDIGECSDVIKALRKEERIYRYYVPSRTNIDSLESIWREVTS